jgi:hypothetical protein
VFAETGASDGVGRVVGGLRSGSEGGVAARDPGARVEGGDVAPRDKAGAVCRVGP